MDQLILAIGSYPHTERLFGEPQVLDEGTVLRVLPLDSAGGFQQLLADERYDAFEFPIMSYLVARERGAELSALPVFLTRRFVHSRLVWNTRSGVNEPRDLEGRRVGIRYHAFTDGTWARGILSERFGVDLDRITWVTSATETVQDAVLPRNVEHLADAALDEMLLAGELAALVRAPGQDVVGPGIEPMFPDLAAAERDWFEATGVLPVLHLVVLRGSALASRSHLVTRLGELLVESKEQALAHIAGATDLSGAELDLAKRQSFLGSDPLPYGVVANRRALEMAVRFAVEQRVLRQTLELEHLFVA